MHFAWPTAAGAASRAVGKVHAFSTFLEYSINFYISNHYLQLWRITKSLEGEEQQGEGGGEVGVVHG